MPATGIIVVGYVWLGIIGIVSIVLALRLRTWTKRFSHGEGDDKEEINNF
ncbi:hypothetical protein ACFLV6_02065 [Chloroflexota bacterium]